MHSSITGKTRVRVCGILEEGNSVLLIKHKGIGSDNFLWSPPGGGLEYGEQAESRLIQEFKEEVNIDVEIVKFLFINEYIQPPLHAIELFFSVQKTAGEISLGTDPEFDADNQILEEVRFIDYKKIIKMPYQQVHNAFKHLNGKKSITELTGFIKFGDI